LQLLLAIFPAVVHKGPVIERLDIDPVLERLRSKIRKPQYIIELLQRLLLDNRHRVRLTMEPDAELGRRREQALRARLEARRRALRSEQEQELLTRAAALAERQQIQDDPEILPRVGLADVPEDFPIPSGRLAGDSPPVTCFTAGTNGLIYQQAVFPLPELGETELELLPDYITCLTELGCDGLDYRQTQAWQARVTGGIGASYKVRGGLDEVDRVRGYFSLSGRALNRNHQEMTRLLRRTLESVRFDEYDHIREIMAQVLAHQEQRVTASGHLLAMRAAAAGCSSIAAMNHRVGGLAGLKKMKRLYAEISGDAAHLERFCDDFIKLHERLCSSPVQFLLVGEAEREEDLLTELRQGWQGFAAGRQQTGPAFSLPEISAARVRQLWTTDTRVNFCAQAYRTVPIGHPDAAPLAVLGGFLRNGYLHRAIREEGGAYGGGAGHDPGSAVFRFYSYRDPRLLETLDDFQASLQWLLREQHDPRQVEEAILGVVSQIDKPGSPAGQAKRAFYDALFGRSPEFIRESRKRVLAVGLDDLRRVAETYLLGEPDGIAVLTSPENARQPGIDSGFEVVGL
jgi:Zn-dependent M16 (insulinase) family peptidase